MPEASSRSDKPAADAARLVASALRAHSRRSRDELAKVVEAAEHAHVHDVRVALRRLLSTLELAAALAAPAPRELVRRLERTLSSLSPLRDLEVERHTLERMSKHEPELAETAAALEHDRAALAKTLTKKLARFELGEAELALERAAELLELEAPPPHASKLMVLAEVARAYTKFDRRRRAVSDGDHRGVHRARVAFKRFRYTVEAAMPLLPAHAARGLLLMKQFQDELGAIQDASVLLETLRRARPFRRRGGSERARALLAALEREHELRVQAMIGVLMTQAAADPPAFSEIFADAKDSAR